MKISLIEFSVENFKIFKDKASLALFARKSEHTFPQVGLNLLKTTSIFGPNASGKSSILEALNRLIEFVRQAGNSANLLKAAYQPFLLADQKDQPVTFSLTFSIDQEIYFYQLSFLAEKIVKEKLIKISKSTKKETILFNRKQQRIIVAHSFAKSEAVAKEMTRPDTLFLVAAAQWKNQLAMKLIESLRNVNVISGLASEQYGSYTINLFDQDQVKRKKIIRYLQETDFSIETGRVEKTKIPNISIKSGTEKQLSEYQTIYFEHSRFNDQGKKIGSEELNLGLESEGTKKFFEIIGPIIDTLEQGKVLAIDEFSNGLHSSLSQYILNLFSSPITNPHHAQLIVATHDTNLMNQRFFNREQVWFTEKNKDGSARLFSLLEFDIRNEVDFAKKYQEGRFGALPNIRADN